MMSPIGYNDFGGYALFQAVKEYKNSPDIPEPGLLPDEENNIPKKRVIRRVSLWQRSNSWVARLLGAKKPEIADQC